MLHLNSLRRHRQSATVGQRPVRYLSSVDIALTAVFRKVPDGYIGYVEDLPGANTQGSTLEEARENLLEAVELVLEANRTMARQEAGQADLIREPLKAAHG
jgi:predicted RNase H-like HicB family nuclease